MRRLSAVLRVLLLTLAASNCGPVSAGNVLEHVRAQDRLRCGVSEGIAGFSVQDADGHWSGLDVDFCRAVAAAVLGDPGKVKFVPLTASARFPALQMGAIDLLVRNTTWTLAREGLLGVRFPGILFYDGQTFMVSATAGITKVSELAGATVCIENGTRHEDNLRDWFRTRELDFTPLLLESATEAAAALFAGRCRAYTSDSSQLAALRLAAPGGAKAFSILDERISKEPLGPVVPATDAEWVVTVRWVLFALLEAEERGFGAKTVADRVQQNRALGIGNLSEADATLVATALGLQRSGLIRAVEAVGNYGEMFDRNLGRDSPLGLDRGLNRLWTEGGLMFAPPIR